MIGSAIRSLACGRESQLLVAAFVQRVIQVWDLASRQIVTALDTNFDFGGRGRLAISADGQRCLVAAWVGGRRGGVSCYETETGDLVWHRPELKQTQYVSFSPLEEFVWWTPEAGHTKRLFCRSGEPESLWKGSPRVFEDPYSDALLIAPRNQRREYIFRHSRPLPIQRCGFAVLDVSFSFDSFCISEAGGPVRCFSSLDGQERWRYDPPERSHILQIHFCGSLNAFYGVLHQFSAFAKRHLVRLDPSDGACTYICDLHRSWDECFAERFSMLITSTGALFRLSDGSEIGHLAFPEKEYPDEPMSSA